MKCKWRGINHHRTRDQASSGAAQALAVGKFPDDHSAVCNCMASNGKMKPEDCDGLCVYDADNAEVARFTGKQFRAQQGEDGLIVFAMPDAESEESVPTQDRTPITVSSHINRLAELNAKNRDFWSKRNGTA